MRSYGVSGAFTMHAAMLIDDKMGQYDSGSEPIMIAVKSASDIDTLMPASILHSFSNSLK
jgi:hypothetical protein